jgi:hypothetical protein
MPIDLTDLLRRYNDREPLSREEYEALEHAFQNLQKTIHYSTTIYPSSVPLTWNELEMLRQAVNSELFNLAGILDHA